MKLRSKLMPFRIFFAFLRPPGILLRPQMISSSFSNASSLPFRNLLSCSPGSRTRMLLCSIGINCIGFSSQRALVMSISPGQRIPYLSKNLLNASQASLPPESFAISSKKFSLGGSLEMYSNTSEYLRIVSATSHKARPISVVTLLSTDLERESATFFSPSHFSTFLWRKSLTSIPAMMLAYYLDKAIREYEEKLGLLRFKRIPH